MRILATLLLSTSLMAQQSEPRMTTEEALQIKLSLLEQQLAQAQKTIADMKQQIIVMQIRGQHKDWNDDVKIRVRDGNPEAFREPHKADSGTSAEHLPAH